jgi:hypothetical protein
MTTATNAAAAMDAHPVTAMHAWRELPWNSRPPNVGPTMNASVHDASLHAIHCGRSS